MPMPHNDFADELKRDLVDPQHVLSGLGLLDRSTQRGRSYVIRCLWHDERTPSCTVAVGPSRTLRCHCFGCEQTWDVLALIAAVHRLDTRADFPRVLVAAAELANRWDIIEAIEGRTRKHQAPKPPPPRPAPEPERDYPAVDALAAFWDACSDVTADAEVCSWLEGRAIPPKECNVRLLCRALGPTVHLPPWARAAGLSWVESGHRCIVPVFDDAGARRSVRARRVRAGAGPKCLAPAGCRIGGLVMADPVARDVLELGNKPVWWPGDAPLRIVVAEGDPDYLTWAARAVQYDPPLAVLGIESGGWTDEIARRIPNNARIIVRTHHDEAGERYAAKVIATLAHRCTVMRSEETP